MPSGDDFAIAASAVAPSSGSPENNADVMAECFECFWQRTTHVAEAATLCIGRNFGEADAEPEETDRRTEGVPLLHEEVGPCDERNPHLEDRPAGGREDPVAEPHEGRVSGLVEAEVHPVAHVVHHVDEGRVQAGVTPPVVVHEAERRAAAEAERREGRPVHGRRTVQRRHR